jgi:NADPH-dependent 2,4-dienoyl-CoA reductase/sulfur reductase-like enzyme/rhodanese-related sulfurtransferase
MAKKILVIGAVALGPKAACRLRRLDPDADILMIDRDTRISYGGCGIPYYVSGDVADVKDLVSTVFHVERDPQFFADYKRIRVRTGVEALSIDRPARRVRARELASGRIEELPYDTLVLATGSLPVVPPVEGADLPGVHTVANLHDAENVKQAASTVERAVVVGAGPIGLEMAEALADLWGVETTVVEMAARVLPVALGPEMSGLVRAEFARNNVEIRTDDAVSSIQGSRETGVTGVITSSGAAIPCELVVFAVGARPNARLGAEAGLSLGRFGGLLVDARMRTSDPNIYAGGDCCEVRHLISGESVHMPMGSLANRQGRVIGTNIAGGRAFFPGALGAFCMKAFESAVATAGLTATQAGAAGFDPAEALVVMSDRAHFYPTQKNIFIKLVADRATRRLLGVEVFGANPDAVKSRADAVAALMAGGGDVDDLCVLEVGYAPPLASAMDAVNAVANVMSNILDSHCRPMSPEEFVRGYAAGDFRVLDVRSPDNAAPYQGRHGENWHNIPQGELAGRVHEVPVDKPLVLFCNTGLRSHECGVLLAGKGIEACNVQGGHGLLRELYPDFAPQE